ncbi:hypothetical protein Tco_0344141 [Tanacetum coccineum]
MLDYGFNFMNTQIFIDNESIISIVKNPVYHSKTKHIEIRHHFIRDSYEKKLIHVLKMHTDDNVADLLTKAFDGPRFNFLVTNFFRKSMDLKLDGCCDDDDLSHIWLYLSLSVKVTIDSKAYTITEASVEVHFQWQMHHYYYIYQLHEIHEGLATMGQEPEIPQSQGPTPTPVADEATTTTGLDSGNIHESPLRSHDAPLPEVNTLRSAEDSVQQKELMELVKTLEVSLKSKSKKVVLSESEGEEAENSSKQGRKSQDDRSKDFITSSNSGEAQEQDISPILLNATNTLTQVASGGVSTYKRRRRSIDNGMDYFSAAKERTKSEEVNTGSTGVNTGATPYRLRRIRKCKVVEEMLDCTEGSKASRTGKGLDLQIGVRKIGMLLELSLKQIRKGNGSRIAGEESGNNGSFLVESRIHQGRYDVSVPALTKDHEGNMINTPYPEKTNTPLIPLGVDAEVSTSTVQETTHMVSSVKLPMLKKVSCETIVPTVVDGEGSMLYYTDSQAYTSSMSQILKACFNQNPDSVVDCMQMAIDNRIDCCLPNLNEPFFETKVNMNDSFEYYKTDNYSLDDMLEFGNQDKKVVEKREEVVYRLDLRKQDDMLHMEEKNTDNYSLDDMLDSGNQDEQVAEKGEEVVYRLAWENKMIRG